MEVRCEINAHMNYMIEIQNLSAGYKGIEKLHSISTYISPEKVTAVIGPNGCGKSTLLKSIAGIITPFSGNIVLDEKSIYDYKPKELARKAAYMPQSRNVPSITAEAMVLHGRFPYLSYPRHYTVRDINIVTDALKSVGIYELRDKNLESMSGGERQKVYLAMVMAQDTSIVLLDEPATFLDIDCQLDVWEIAKKMKDMNKTVIMVSHDIIQTLRYADDIIVMKEGAILSHGNTDDVFTSGILSDVFKVKIDQDNMGRYYYI